jgi:hypothetical protein
MNFSAPLFKTSCLFVLFIDIRNSEHTESSFLLQADFSPGQRAQKCPHKCLYPLSVYNQLAKVESQIFPENAVKSTL